MGKTFTFLFSLCVFTGLAQSPSIVWEHSVGGSGYDSGRSVAFAADGGCFAVGHTLSTDIFSQGNHGLFDMLVAKYSADGSMQWHLVLGGSGYDYAYDVKATADGGCVVAGTSDSNDGDFPESHGFFDFCVIKLDAQGNIEWKKLYGGNFSDQARSIVQTSDGGFVAVGDSFSNNGQITDPQGSTDIWVVKLSAEGDLEWQKSFGGSNIDSGQDVTIAANGDYVFTGFSNSTNGMITSNHGMNDLWAFRTDSQGNLLWQHTLGGSQADVGYTIVSSQAGGFAIAGFSASVDGDVTGNHGTNDYWVVKLSESGVLEWQKSLGGSSVDICAAICKTNDGGYALLGDSSSNNGDATDALGGIPDFWVVAIDAVGNIVWKKRLGGNGSDIGYGIAADAQGNLMVIGETSSNDLNVSQNLGNSDIWLAKLAPSLGMESYVRPSPYVYPNPANDQLFVKLPDGLVVDRISITDLNGRKIKSSFRSDYIATDGLSSGSYLIESVSGDKSFTSKFIKK